MFDSLDPAAREIFVQAQRQARELNHHYLGTEHVLLALALAIRRKPVAEIAASASETRPSNPTPRAAGRSIPKDANGPERSSASPGRPAPGPSTVCSTAGPAPLCRG